MARSRFKLTAPIIREGDLHQAVARVLRLEIAAPLHPSLQGVTWFTQDIAGYVGVAPGIRTSHGVVAGVPDILVLWGPRAHWIELKAMDGMLSPAQARGAVTLLSIDCKYAIARSIAEVLAALDEWGIPRAHRIEVEPPGRSSPSPIMRA